MKKSLCLVGATVLALALSACGSTSAAEAACHEAALKRAKHPGNAEIVQTNIEKGDDGIIHVSGLADFPNGFGIPVRHTYFCNANTSHRDISVENTIVMEGDWINLDDVSLDDLYLDYGF